MKGHSPPIWLGDSHILAADLILQIESLPRFGHRRIQNIFSAIEASKKTPASKLLLALGIPGIGAVTADMLLNHFGSIMVRMQRKKFKVV